jgi:DNA-binding MarR family transcriptional regulator
LHGARTYGRLVRVPPATAPSPTTTGQQLVLALLSVARRLKTREVHGQLDPASVFVLSNVQAKAPLRVSELARCLGLDSSTVSRHVRHLEDGGYLVRAGDPADRRASRVQLTGRGRAVLDEAMRARAAIVDTATADWPPADRATLTTLMARLAEHLDRLAAETES